MIDLPAIRAAMSTALNEVDGVKSTPHYRQIARPGEALVRHDNTIRDTSGFGWIVTMQALIVLPQELAAAETWIDSHLDAVLDALAGTVVVGQAQPITLQLDTGSVPALQITGTWAA